MFLAARLLHRHLTSNRNPPPTSTPRRDTTGVRKRNRDVDEPSALDATSPRIELTRTPSLSTRIPATAGIRSETTSMILLSRGTTRLNNNDLARPTRRLPTRTVYSTPRLILDPAGPSPFTSLSPTPPRHNKRPKLPEDAHEMAATDDGDWDKGISFLESFFPDENNAPGVGQSMWATCPTPLDAAPRLFRKDSHPYLNYLVHQCRYDLASLSNLVARHPAEDQLESITTASDSNSLVEFHTALESTLSTQEQVLFDVHAWASAYATGPPSPSSSVAESEDPLVIQSPLLLREETSPFNVQAWVDEVESARSDNDGFELGIETPIPHRSPTLTRSRSLPDFWQVSVFTQVTTPTIESSPSLAPASRLFRRTRHNDAFVGSLGSAEEFANATKAQSGHGYVRSMLPATNKKTKIKEFFARDEGSTRKMKLQSKTMVDVFKGRQVAWKDFCKAMKDLGFRCEHPSETQVMFSPARGPSVTLDRPKKDSFVEPMLDVAEKLRKVFGWELNDFLAQ